MSIAPALSEMVERANKVARPGEQRQVAEEARYDLNRLIVKSASLESLIDAFKEELERLEQHAPSQEEKQAYLIALSRLSELRSKAEKLQ